MANGAGMGSSEMKAFALAFAALAAVGVLAGCANTSAPATPAYEQKITYVDTNGNVSVRTITPEPKPRIDLRERLKGIMPDPSCSRCEDTVLSPPSY